MPSPSATTTRATVEDADFGFASALGSLNRVVAKARCFRHRLRHQQHRQERGDGHLAVAGGTGQYAHANDTKPVDTQFGLHGTNVNHPAVCVTGRQEAGVEAIAPAHEAPVRDFINGLIKSGNKVTPGEVASGVQNSSDGNEANTTPADSGPADDGPADAPADDKPADNGPAE